MDIERVENIPLESAKDVPLESDDHVSSGKKQTISVTEKEPRDKSENSVKECQSQKSERIRHLNIEESHAVSISMPLERNKMAENKKARHKKHYFCCGSLAAGAVASVNYSNAISMSIIVISLHMFFRTSEADDGINKALSFSAIIYAICYIRSGTSLKRAINEELREKIIPWIIFSTFTVFFLLSGAIYVSVTYWEELDDFDEDLTTPCLRLILIVFLIFIGCILIYCTYGVIRLFKSLAEVEGPGNSLVNEIQDFIYGVSV